MGLGPRLAAVTLDWAPCFVAAQLLTAHPSWAALSFFAGLTVLSLVLFGRTPGHAALGFAVVTRDGGRPGPLAVLVRTALLCLAIPAVLFDADWRGLHDRLAGTVVVRTR